MLRSIRSFKAQPTMFNAAVHITLLAVFFASSALAAGEASEAHFIVETGTSQNAILKSPWDFRQSYSVSVLGLWESGQGFGARFNLLPSPEAARTWDFSADAVVRLANESPWYLKGIGGIAIVSPSALWPPRLRAGAEIGLTAILSGIGLEAGIGAVVSFPPSGPMEGEGGTSGWAFSSASVRPLSGDEGKSPPGRLGA
jgi:hypothetical protein